MGVHEGPNGNRLVFHRVEVRKGGPGQSHLPVSTEYVSRRETGKVPWGSTERASVQELCKCLSEAVLRVRQSGKEGLFLL